ncbi:MAG: DUF1566 domain-containing protein [Erysipelotrichaceae bacterium]
MKKNLIYLLSLCCVLSACTTSDDTTNNDETTTSSYDSPIVETGQTNTYDADGNIITTTDGDAFYGQDGDYESLSFSFTLNDNGTTTDNNTGLTWVTNPDGGKLTWDEAVEYVESLNTMINDDGTVGFGGYTDWRLPSTEELFSVSDFSIGWPYIDTDYFGFDNSESSGSSMGGMSGSPQGSSSQSGSPQGSDSESSPTSMMDESMEALPEGEMASDAGGVSKEEGQYWTSEYNQVEGDDRLGDIAFGVNHATGHIKAYPSDSAQMGKYVRAVRGDDYGTDSYTDNGDGTITDNSSGLMWMQTDLGVAVDWEEALSLAENYEYAGYDDWRLPDVKELQSIVDYAGSYPAIDQDYFICIELEENENYYFWTSTSAYFSEMEPDYNSAWYVAFGYTSHGAGAVRFSPKYEGSDALSEGEDNILNSVRLVRNIE